MKNTEKENVFNREGKVVKRKDGQRKRGSDQKQEGNTKNKKVSKETSLTSL